MTEPIAERSLCYSFAGGNERRDLVIRIFPPFVVPPGSVSFNVDGVISGCRWEIDGLPEDVGDTVYGADAIQALQLASNVDGLIRHLRRKYVFYFPTGEPYFDE
jgi:hypothetical protein